jgi:ABC-type uncharacterized transport system substrate-binding protein
MRRREFITLLGATAAASPLAAYAEQAGGTPVLGVLMAGLESAPDNQKRIAAFRQTFAELGWKDRDNIRIEYRWSQGKEGLIRQYAQELVALSPSVILANSTPVIAEFKPYLRWLWIRSATAMWRASPIPAATSPASPSSIRN